MIDVINLFTTPLFAAEYPDCIQAKDCILPIFKSIEDSDENPYSYTPNGYTSFSKGNVLQELNECKELHDWIKNIVLNIHVKSGLSNKIDITQSWFSINRQYSYHEEHNHIPSIWSGVYYLQAENDDAKIVFSNNNFESNWPYTPVQNFTEYNTREKGYPAVTGTLFVFPSYLKHRVEAQLIDRERVSIAFNAGHLTG
jgi:uncharacterized protein (TIGR02466 family)